MGIGLGVVLLVLGLILVLNVVQFDIGFIDDQGLGWIFLILTLWVCYFFRDPERIVPVGELYRVTGRVKK